MEEAELGAHRGQIVSNVKALVEKFRAVFDWDVPDIDQALADQLIIAAIRKALDEVERELAANRPRKV
jgi:hypothetical protein